MKQIFYHYTRWEDFQNGMYDEDKDGRRERVKLAAQLLSDPPRLYEEMTRVTQEWKCATEQNLTNASINHQAFLGQTACAIWGGVHEDETREAWGTLTNQQRYAANKVADRVFEEWVQKHADVSQQMTVFEMEEV